MGVPHSVVDFDRDPRYQGAVSRGVGLLVAAACFLACAPAWAGGAVSDAGFAVRDGARARSGSAVPRQPLGSLALQSAPSDAGLVGLAQQGRPKAHLSITPSRLSYRGGHVRFSISAPNATRCTLGSKPRFFAGPNPQRVRCHGKQTLSLPAVALGLHWTFKFTARNARGKSVATKKLVLQAPPFAVSRNWSGYAVPSTVPVTSVSGRFTVPTLNCAKTPNAGESTWVGIGGDGASSGELLQTGVRSDCLGGTQDNNPAWWEEFPQVAEQKFLTLTVSPGDSMQATVSKNPDGISWTTRLDDLTKGISGLMTTGGEYGTQSDANLGAWLHDEGSAASISYAGGYSAEWIVEAFALGNGSIVPLADFGKLTFSGLTASVPSWTLTQPEQIGLGQGPFLVAAPTAPDATGRGFSIAYTG